MDFLFFFVNGLECNGRNYSPKLKKPCILSLYAYRYNFTTKHGSPRVKFCVKLDPNAGKLKRFNNKKTINLQEANP